MKKSKPKQPQGCIRLGWTKISLKINPQLWMRSFLTYPVTKVKWNNLLNREVCINLVYQMWRLQARRLWPRRWQLPPRSCYRVRSRIQSRYEKYSGYVRFTPVKSHKIHSTSVSLRRCTTMHYPAQLRADRELPRIQLAPTVFMLTQKDDTKLWK